MTEILQQKVLFDGGENPAKWKALGIPEGKVPDQFVERCEMGAVNLHSFRIGWYEGCGDVKKEKLVKIMVMFVQNRLRFNFINLYIN